MHFKEAIAVCLLVVMLLHNPVSAIGEVNKRFFDGGSKADIFAPSAPTNLKLSEITETSLLLTWSAAKDNDQVASYEIFMGDKKMAVTANLRYRVSGLNQNSSLFFKVFAYDRAGNRSIFWASKAQPPLLQIRNTTITHNFRMLHFQNDQKPMNVDGVTYVSARPFAEKIGLQVQWNASNRNLLLTGNGKSETFKNSIINYNQQVWLPIAAIARTFDYIIIRHQATIARSIHLDVPLIKQMPELYNGCEVTSMTMLLQFAGFRWSKMQLAQKLPKDTTPLKMDGARQAVYWGNPNVGFVGDVTGKRRGYAIYHKPLHLFLQKYIPSAIDLTGQPFAIIEQKLAEGKPVIVWTTAHFNPPYRWVSWQSPTGKVRATYEEHSVLLTGYDDNYVYLNDPLAAKKHYKIAKSRFIRGWKALGQQAISY